MAQRTIEKVNGVDRVFITNHKRGSEYIATIMNNTGAVLNLTYTNQDVQVIGSPTFGALTGQPATVADGAIECLTCPVEAINFAGTGTGTVDIVEAT